MLVFLLWLPAPAWAQGEQSPLPGDDGVSVQERPLPDHSIEVWVRSHGSEYFGRERKPSEMVRERGVGEQEPIVQWRLLDFGSPE